MNYQYQLIETQIRALVESLSPPICESQACEVLHFVDVGEYGIALETLVALLREEGIKLSAEASSEVLRLAKFMHLDYSDWDL